MAVRAATVRNHSATHLMHKALREVLGSHVQQKGSLVNAERTRFDFAHNAPVTDAEIRQIEDKVNAEILANATAQARVKPGATATVVFTVIEPTSAKGAPIVPVQPLVDTPTVSVDVPRCK